MDKKAFFDNLRKEANTALSKVFDKVEEVSKVSALKIKITNHKSHIKGFKKDIGTIVFNNIDKFGEHVEIIELADKIKHLEEDIEIKKDQINELKEKEEKEKEAEKDNSDNTFSL
jgi:ubiquinone biosynthesis protein UbiJ